MKPTIYEIKKRTANKQPYFFTRNTLNFNGQTLRHFRVNVSPTGRIYIYAPSYYRGRLMGYTFWEFVNNDDLAACLDADDKSLQGILVYIEAH